MSHLWKQIQEMNCLEKTYQHKAWKQNRKVCNESFKTMIKVLSTCCYEHSKSIREVSSRKPKENKDNVSNDLTKQLFDWSSKFKCYKCKEVVSLDNKFNDDLKEEQMCNICKIISAYG